MLMPCTFCHVNHSGMLFCLLPIPPLLSTQNQFEQKMHSVVSLNWFVDFNGFSRSYSWNGKVFFCYCWSWCFCACWFVDLERSSKVDPTVANSGKSGFRLDVCPRGDYQSSDIQVKSKLDNDSPQTWILKYLNTWPLFDMVFDLE